ncbi:MAG TPA: hypothetical protein VL096_19120, partial [Pirellulaceae bacterium]|nr:hypothetical protein [Pirellulaceae bacterium]
MSLSLAPRYLLVGLALLLGGASSLLAAPVVNQVSLRGLQVGGTTTLTLNGNDLLSEARLIAPFAIAKQELLPGATTQQVQLRITLAGDVRPGLFAVRLASSQGISPPFMLGVDALPQQALTEQITALPLAMTGSLAGGQIIKASFVGQKGLPLVVDVEAQRLGANFKPVVRLYNSRGQQVAWSAPQHLIGGDARLSLTLPADDTYTIELHDLLYRAAGPGFFRLKVGALTYADFALPLAITKGTTSSVRYASTNTPAGLTTAVDAAALTIPTEHMPLAPPVALFSGAAPSVQISESAEAIETAPAAGQRQLLSNLPCAVSGTIASKGEEDQYLVPVKPGQKLRIAVTARRLGSLLDGVLVVRNAAGNELARNDDQPGTEDPGLEFTVPAGMEQLLLCVRDMEQRFGEAFVYRLAVNDAAAPDVVAAVNLDTLQIPAGGTLVVPVNVVRANYAGPLRITAENAVGNITLGGDEIPANATTTLLTLTAGGGQPVHGVMNLVIRATDANVPLARYVLTPESAATRYQPALRRELGLAVVAPGPISIRWNASVEAEKEFLGATLPLALSITRDGRATGDVRLRLMSTQPMPKKKK